MFRSHRHSSRAQNRVVSEGGRIDFMVWLWSGRLRAGLQDQIERTDSDAAVGSIQLHECVRIGSLLQQCVDYVH